MRIPCLSVRVAGGLIVGLALILIASPARAASALQERADRFLELVNAGYQAMVRVESALAEVFDHRLQLNPGAERLLQGLQRAGIRTMLVSGGFTYFTERLKARLGFDHAYANQLEVVEGKLTGKVVGEIVDGEAKAAKLEHVRDALGLRPEQVIAAGDGANDIPMLRAAGFGVAFHAKPVLRDVAHCCLDHTGLDGILDIFGG